MKSIIILLIFIELINFAPINARWLVAETANFRVYSEGNEKNLRTVSDNLEDYWETMQDLTGVPALEGGPRLDVYLVPDLAAMREIRDLPSGAAGFYVTGPTRPLALALQTSGSTKALNTQYLFHEVAHHFMFQNRMAAYPSWYVEGFAEYMMTAQLGEDRVTIGDVNPGRAYALNSGPWIIPADFFGKKAREFGPNDIGTYYAQSWLTVHYMFRDPARLAGLKSFLQQANDGKADEAAFRKAFGTDYRGFEKDLRAYFGSRKITMSSYRRASAAAQATSAIRALPVSADKLVIAQAHLRAGVEPARVQTRLAQIRQEAAKFPSDPFAKTVLAEAEVDLGDLKVGAGLLDGLIEAEPRNADLLTLRGYAALRLNDGTTGRRLLARAHKIDPSAAAPLFFYGASFLQVGVPPSENTLNTLLLAADIAPQIPGITMLTATALMKAKRFDDAIKILGATAYNPHGGPTADIALKMINDARAGQMPDAVAQVSGTKQE